MQTLLLCECNHLTEFTVMMYHTAWNGTTIGMDGDGALDASALANRYKNPMNIRVQMYVCLALMMLVLGNSTDGIIIIKKAKTSQLKNMNGAMLNITIFNTLLMISIVFHTSTSNTMKQILQI